MVQHVYLIKATGLVDAPGSAIALIRASANITVKTSAKGEALAKELLEAAEQAFQREGQVESVFDCGEEPEASDEAI